MKKLFNIAVNINHNQGILTYAISNINNDTNYSGRRVIVKIKNRSTLGVIMEEVTSPKAGIVIKDIEAILDDHPIITSSQLELIKFAARYYVSPLGPLLHIAIPKDKNKAKNIIAKNINTHHYHLNEEQENAVNIILNHQHKAFLLEGITGSGKTIVYLAVAKHMLMAKKSVLFLVPEIALTPELIDRVESYLGKQAHVIHSHIAKGKKRDSINDLLTKEGEILIGTRSAIFAPLLNLGLIVVDEEHDQSFKQDENPRYHARDLALWRAYHEKAYIILGSATPSLESMYNVERHKLIYIKLNTRFSKQSLPKVHIIDLKQPGKLSDSSKILSLPLITQMKSTLDHGLQVLLFLNQRGYGKLGICHSCGHTDQCPNCSVLLTYYQHKNYVQCHQCQYRHIALGVCSHCHEHALYYIGLGTERLAEEITRLFPNHNMVRLDKDVITSQKKLINTLNAVHQQEADILIGTQLIAKGHNFLHIGLVGIISADIALAMPDFRAAEKNFQLLTQVSGRAGRGEVSGKVLIQTYNPKHPSIVYAQDHNTKDFIAQELPLRKRFMLPPFTKALLIRCEHKDLSLATEAINSITAMIAQHKHICCVGPMPCPIEKINHRYRLQSLLTAKSSKELHEALNALTSKINHYINNKKIKVIIDVDPYNML